MPRAIEVRNTDGERTVIFVRAIEMVSDRTNRTRIHLLSGESVATAESVDSVLSRIEHTLMYSPGEKVLR